MNDTDDRIDVLVVDDSAFFTESMEHVLRDNNLNVATINDSTTVLDFLKKQKPSLILLDIMMPELDGISLCKMIKSNEEFKDIRIVIFSTKLFEADKEKAYNAGAEAFITKSVPVDEIGAQVMRILRKKMTIRFWGTRGSIPTPGPRTVRYGGNTSCVEVDLGGDYSIIFDAGSGIRELGDSLLKSGKRTKGHIFLSHFHWDHIQGLPFFAPIYLPENQFTIYGCENREVKLGKLLADQMESIYFPVPLRRFGAGLQFQPIDEGKHTIEGFRLNTVHLNHPSNTLGFIIEHRQKKFGYLTDNEFITDFTEKPKGDPHAQFDEYNLKIIDFMQDADLIIIDAQYTKEEYQSKRGWGHSHYEAVLTVAMAANVKKCVLFHHDPTHSDEVIDEIVAHSNEIIHRNEKKVDCLGAQEGLEISV